MPAPERTTRAAIVDAGRRLLESHGPAGLTMGAVADEVGVRAPSLYKRVAGRDELLLLVAQATAAALLAALEDVPHHDDPRRELEAQVRAVRAFALASPAGYTLLFTPGPPHLGPEALAAVAGPVLRTAARLAGPDRALEAARTVTAWAHGFLSMELSGGFTLGGDVEEAFDWGLARVAAALASAQG